MNEHGAVNFNPLHTSDTTASKHFYGEVFGWTTFSLGGAEFWALPGYGDHLETISPGIRERTAEMGVAGFEDVVAVLDQLQDGDELHWDVTFRGRRCRRQFVAETAKACGPFLSPLSHSLFDHEFGEPLPGQRVTQLLVRGREPVDAAGADLDPSEQLVVGPDGDINVGV